MKPQLGALAARFLTSDLRRKTSRLGAEAKRRLTGSPHELHYFHQVEDPYSHLMVQVLGEFVERFGLVLCPWVIGSIREDMLPAPEMLQEYGPKDAAALAELYNLDFPENWSRGTPEQAEATGALLTTVAQGAPERFLTEALDLGKHYWRGAVCSLPEAPADWPAVAEDKLTQLGHYLPGTIYYGGEWYWGIDRLDHLENRLIEAGLGHGPIVYDKTWEGVFTPLLERPRQELPPLELYFSARSPYSYISLFQARRFADLADLELILRPVLPMVMRNMKVPLAKRLYIVNDAKREATKARLPFGNIADPVGPGIERSYAVAYWVQQQHPDLLEIFFRSCLTGIASEGIDVATDQGLRKIVERVGLDWSQAKQSLLDTSWRDWVNQHREQMTQLGLWGVPTFRFGELSVWGQDRFWLIRKKLNVYRQVRNRDTPT